MSCALAKIDMAGPATGRALLGQQATGRAVTGPDFGPGRRAARCDVPFFGMPRRRTGMARGMFCKREGMIEKVLIES